MINIFLNQILLIFCLLVTVAGKQISETGKRSYRKPDYCLYCKKKYYSKIAKHYVGKHSAEPRVKEIIQLPRGSKERKRLSLILQNEGNHLHNCEVRHFHMHHWMMCHLFHLLLLSIVTANLLNSWLFKHFIDDILFEVFLIM